MRRICLLTVVSLLLAGCRANQSIGQYPPTNVSVAVTTGNNEQPTAQSQPTGTSVTASNDNLWTFDDNQALPPQATVFSGNWAYRQIPPPHLLPMRFVKQARQRIPP
jgi:hypothetical protein